MIAGDWLLIANTALCVAAALAYAWDRQWPVAVYWLGAVILNSGVLWMRFK